MKKELGEIEMKKHNPEAMMQIASINNHYGKAGFNRVAVGGVDRYLDMQMVEVKAVVDKYGVKTVVVKEFANGIKKYRTLDAEDRIVAEYHGI